MLVVSLWYSIDLARVMAGNAAATTNKLATQKELSEMVCLKRFLAKEYFQKVSGFDNSC